MKARLAVVFMALVAVSIIVLTVRSLIDNNAKTAATISSDGKEEPSGPYRMPKELEHAQIEDKAGAKVPFDVKLTDHNGKDILFSSYFSAEDRRPVVLTLGYYGCPMLCSLVLNGMVDSLKKINFKPGADFRIVSISIDEREKPELAAIKRKAYLAAMDAEPDVLWWDFHVTTANEAKRLADAVGFDYEFDKKTDQFAHGAGFFVLSPDGVLSRTLFGISFKPTDVKLALSDATDGKIGSFIDRVLLSCFHYDPDAHSYGVYIFGVMRLGGVLTVLILGAVLLFYFRQEKKRLAL